jgi:hypothetical protein
MGLRQAMISCKTLLKVRRETIRSLWSESLEHREMLDLIEKM